MREAALRLPSAQEKAEMAAAMSSSVANSREPKRTASVFSGVLSPAKDLTLARPYPTTST